MQVKTAITACHLGQWNEQTVSYLEIQEQQLCTPHSPDPCGVGIRPLKACGRPRQEQWWLDGVGKMEIQRARPGVMLKEVIDSIIERCVCSEKIQKCR